MTDTQNNAGGPVDNAIERLQYAFDESVRMEGIGAMVKTSDLGVLLAHIADNEAAMPTIWEAPAHKGYPTHERPMTPAEAKRAIDDYSKGVAGLEARMAVFNELLCVIHRDGGQYISEHGETKAIADAMQLSSERIAHIAAEPDRMREVVERSDAAQLNLYRQAERDREARRRADEAFDLIAPFVAKFAAAASHYDGGRPCFEGAAHFFHDADPSYGCALTSTATGIGGPGAPQSPTLGDLRLLAAAYQQATAIRAQEIKPRPQENAWDNIQAALADCLDKQKTRL